MHVSCYFGFLCLIVSSCVLSCTHTYSPGHATAALLLSHTHPLTYSLSQATPIAAAFGKIRAHSIYTLSCSHILSDPLFCFFWCIYVSMLYPPCFGFLITWSSVPFSCLMPCGSVHAFSLAHVYTFPLFCILVFTYISTVFFLIKFFFFKFILFLCYCHVIFPLTGVSVWLLSPLYCLGMV